LERLGQAVKLVIDREVLARETQTDNSDEGSRLGMHASIGALQELDA
jgi:hypothetical protein